MGRPDHGGRCWRHPKHRQSIGVCPFCLRERLSRLSDNYSTSSASSSGSSSPYSTDSEVSSSSTSPPHAHTLDVKEARISLLLRQEHALTKSRSMAIVPAVEIERAEVEEEGRKGKEKERKKKKFWAKLLMGGPERKQKMKEANLMHSRTLKEKPSAKWALFA